MSELGFVAASASVADEGGERCLALYNDSEEHLFFSVALDPKLRDNGVYLEYCDRAHSSMEHGAYDVVASLAVDVDRFVVELRSALLGLTGVERIDIDVAAIEARELQAFSEALQAVYLDSTVSLVSKLS